MVMLAWIDFAAHNELTGENVRSFSVNHPQAGRLVVIKGVSAAYDSAMNTLRFTRTKDGSWVIQAKNLSVPQLQSVAFPLLSVKNVALADIDLTAQFLNPTTTPSEPEKPKTHSGLSWLSYLATSDENDEVVRSYQGPIPSSISNTLWAYLDENVESEVQPNGQTHYRGTLNENAFLLVRRQRLLGSADNVIFYMSADRDLLPNLSASSQAPTLFRLSDSISDQLKEVGHFYTHSTNAQLNNEFTPSRSLANARAQQAINTSNAIDGEFIKAALPVERPLVIASGEYSPIVNVSDLVEALGTPTTETLLSFLSDDDWETPVNDQDPTSGRIYATALTRHASLYTLAKERGFDSVVVYRPDANAAPLTSDSFISDNGISLNVIMLNPENANIIQREPRVNQNHIPDGYEVKYLTRNNIDLISIVHTETGAVVTNNNESWFNSLTEAVAAISLPENTYFVDPNPEEISKALDAVYAPSVDVIGYRGEIVSNPENEPFHAREGSISFSSREAATANATDIRNLGESELTARIIEARLTLAKPVINTPDDPFIDFSVIGTAIGNERATAIAIALSSHITATEVYSVYLTNQNLNPDTTVEEVLAANPDALGQLYVEAAPVFANAEWVEWFQKAGFDGAVHGSVDTIPEPEYQVFDEAQVSVLNVVALEAHQQTAELETNTDPALDPERVAKMAVGAKERLGRESNIRKEWHSTVDDRLQAIEARQSTWQEFDSVSCLRINDEPFIAVPTTNRKNAKSYAIFDSRSPDDVITTLNRDEVQSWLYRAFDPSEEVLQTNITINTPSSRGEVILAGLTDSLEITKDVDGLVYQSSSLSTATKEDIEAIVDFVKSQGFTHISTRRSDEYLEQLPTGSARVIINKGSTNQGIRLATIRNNGFDKELILERMDAAIDTVVSRSTAILQHAENSPARLQALNENREAIAHSLRTINELASRISDSGESIADIIARSLPDIAALGDPALAEVYNRTIDDDVPVIIESMESMMIRAAKNSEAHQDIGYQENRDVDELNRLREECLYALTTNKSFSDASITITYVDGDWRASFGGVEVAAGNGGVTRQKVNESLLRDLKITSVITPSTYAKLQEDTALLLRVQETLDPIFQDRWYAVRNALVSDFKFNVSQTNHFISESGKVSIRSDFTRVGSGNNIAGLSYSVGDHFLVDDLTMPPSDMAANLAQWANELEIANDAENEQQAPVIKEVDISSISSLEALEEALFAGKKVVTEDGSFEVVQSSPGWVVIEGHEGYSTTLGGDIMGGGFSQYEAINRVKQSLDYLFPATVIESEQPEDANPVDQVKETPYKETPSDLFGGAVEGDPIGKVTAITLQEGSSPTNIVVTGAGIMTVDSELVGLGGRFIKKYAGYRFKKSDEPKVRHMLDKHVKAGSLTLIDRIRKPTAITLGMTIRKNGTVLSLNNITPTEDGQDYKLTFVGGNPDILVINSHTTVRTLESDIEITVTNWDELQALYGRAHQQEAAPATQEPVEVLNIEDDAIEPESPLEPSAEPIVTRPTLQVIETAPQDAELAEPEKHMIIRGKAHDLIGINSQGKSVYVSGDGLRTLLDDELNLDHEIPFVSETGTIIPPLTRLPQFKLLSELVAEAELENNVVSINRNRGNLDEVKTFDAKELSEEEYNTFLRNEGIEPELLTEFIRAYGQWRKESDRDTENNNSFVVRRLSAEVDKKQDMLNASLAKQGRFVDQNGLRVFAEHVYVNMSERREKLTNEISAVMFNQLAEKQNLNLEFARGIQRNNAQSLPGYWLYDEISRLSHNGTLNSINTINIILAKAYGTQNDIDRAINTADLADKALSTELNNELLDRFKTVRANVEIPATINKLNDMIAVDTNISPIPRSNMSNKIAGLYKELAAAQYDIDALPIEEEDIDIYKNSYNASDYNGKYAERKSISVDAAGLFAVRVSKEIAARAQAEFSNLPETRLCLEMAELVKAQLPNGVKVTATDKINTNAIEFLYGSGKISISRPEKRFDSETYTIHYSHQSHDRFTSTTSGYGTVDYKKLPTAEQFAKDVLSFAKLHEATAKVYLSPDFGQKIPDLPEGAKYNNTVIAKAIREDIKEAIKSGALPKGLKVGINKSGHNSISLTVKGLPDDFPVLNPEFVAYRAREDFSFADHNVPQKYTHEATALSVTLNRYLNAYNFDNSDRNSDYFHVNYYDRFYFDDDLTNPQIRPVADYLPIQESEKRIYKLLNRESFDAVERFKSLGFAYVGDRRLGLQFNVDGEFVVEEVLTRAPDAVTNHLGITDLQTENAPLLLKLAYSAVQDAFNLENKDFHATNLLESLDPEHVEPDLLPLVKDVVEKIGVNDHVLSGDSCTINYTSNLASASDIKVILDGGILTISDDLDTLIEVDTTVNEWLVINHKDSAEEVLSNILNDRFSEQSTNLRVNNLPSLEENIEPSLHVYIEDEGATLVEVNSSRLDIFDAYRVIPTPISTPTSNGKHFIGARVNETNTFDAFLSSAMPSGDNVGFSAIAFSHPSRNAALVEVAKAFEEYATEAFRQKDSQAITEAVLILTYIERSIGMDSFKSSLINDRERKIAAEGGKSIINYLEALAEANPFIVDSHYAVVNKVTLPAVDGFSGQGEFTLAKINDAEFIYGVTVPLEDGETLSVEMDEMYGVYPGAEEAASSFKKTLQALAPLHADKIAQAIDSAFINEIPAPSSTVDLPAAVSVSREQLDKAIKRRYALQAQKEQLGNALQNSTEDDETSELQESLKTITQEIEELDVTYIINLLHRSSPLVDQLDTVYVTDLASRYSELRHLWNQYHLNLADIATKPNDAILDKWIAHTGMDSTHTSNGRAFDHKEPVLISGDLVVISKQSNQEADPVYHLDISDYPLKTQETIANHARLSGALIEGQNVLFSSIDDLDSFAETNDLTYTITDQVVGNAPIIRTETRNSNVSQALARDLQAAGYVQSHYENVWLTSTVNNDSVQVSFYKGIDGQSLDAKVLVGNGKDRSVHHFTGWQSSIDRHEVEQLINEFLQESGYGPILSPAAEPSINTITDEQICQILLGAGLNIENVDNEWHVSGETFRYRNTLAHLGGDYRNTDTKKPIWSFSEPPAKRLASAISGHVSTMGTTQYILNGFILTQTYNANDNQFLVVLSQGDPEKSIITGVHSSLMKAKTSIVSAIIDEDKLKELWKKVFPAAISPATHEDEDNARKTRSATSDPQRTDSRLDAASPVEREPNLGGSTVAGVSSGLASQSRGNDRRNSGSGNDNGNGQVEQTRPISTGSGDPTPLGKGSRELSDGRTLGGSGDRHLFDLKAARNNIESGSDALGKYTLEALRTLNLLRAEDRQATDEEKTKLARMVGLGAAQFNGSRSNIFNNYENRTINRFISDEINKLPSEERHSIKSTVLTAFYTPESITDFMWKGLVRMGVKPTLASLDVVDPGVGTGHFIGSAPEFVRKGANIHGIESDKVTAEIASLLYPEARIIHQEFQKVLYPRNSKDLFIGNPPYSDVRTYNPNTGKREVLHDLFLRESINATRPGGMVAFVTSSGTLDKKGNELRKYIATQADLICALRLPNGAFSEDAGTEVMTDILYFRKRKSNEQAISTDWTEVVEQSFTFNNEIITLPVNQYFNENPQNVLGQLEAVSGQFGPTLSCRASNTPLADLLEEKVNDLPEDIFSPTQFKEPSVITTEPVSKPSIRSIDNDLPDSLKVGSLYIDKDNEIRIVRYDGGEANYFGDIANIKKSEIKLMSDYILLRDVLKGLVEAESKPLDPDREKFITQQRRRLNDLYDRFVNDHGPIGRKNNLKTLRKDPDSLFVAQVEHYDRESDSAIKADVLLQRVIQSESEPVITNALDAAHISMSQYGFISPEFVADKIGENWDSIRETLGESIYYDPEAGQYTVASVYLCGDVVHKREVAERALHDMPEMERNIQALKDATPKPISITDIRVKIGATWIPEEVLTDFAREILQATSYGKKEKCVVPFNETLKEWNFKVTELVLRDAKQKNTIEYGTNDVPFHKLFKHCLEQTRPTVTREDSDGNRYVDTEATQAARDKQQIIEDSFVSFILQNAERAKTMEDQYNYQMNRIVPPAGNGKYLSFPGITSELKGKPFKFGDHQLAVVERGITSEYGLLIAHEAGGGKTISTTVIAIKNKQLGLAKKPLIAVPNHMLIQYTTEALDVYPNARILTVNKDDLNAEGRENFAHKCRLNDWDLVICTHEQFTKLKMPQWYIESSINNEITELEEMITSNSGDRATIKQLERQKKALKERLSAEIAKLESNQDQIEFTELGIDWIGYDEGHYLKNRAFPTKNSQLAGVQTLTSQRSRDAEMKFDWVRESRGDKRGVLLATGTPISNTIGEMMVILRYLAPELLQRAGIYNFDNFIAAFGETKVHIELTADGSGYQLKERLSGFHNIPELMRIFSVVADIKMGDDLNLVRPKVNPITRLSEMSPEQRLFMDWLGHRARLIKTGKVKPHKDNMLKIYTDLQTISVDPRLYHEKLQDVEDSKVNLEVKDIFRAWAEGKETKATQIIFVDRYRKTIDVPNGLNKDGTQRFKKQEVFNLNEDMKEKLVRMGVPSSDIAFIHDVSTDEEKENLFANIRKGNVRIVFATTAKMGVGTNVQNKGKDLRHLSYPMRSIDLEQRNKRFERQGNENSEINIHYPTTKDSGDLATLQMIDRKDKMLKPIMRLDFENMSRSFEEEHSLSYEEIMALSTDNTVIKQKLETDSKVDTLRRKLVAHQNECYRAKRSAFDNTKTLIPTITEYVNLSIEMKKAINPDHLNGFQMAIGDKHYTKAAEAGAEIHRLINRTLFSKGEKKNIGTYLGFPLKLSKCAFGNHYLSINICGKDIETQVTDKLSYFPGRIASVVRDRISGIVEGQQRIAFLEEETKTFNELAEREFPHLAELKEAEKLQAELNIEMAKLESKNKVIDPDELHPFEILLAKLDGKELKIDNGKESTNKILTEEEIQQALDAELLESNDEVNESNHGLSLVH